MTVKGHAEIDAKTDQMDVIKMRKKLKLFYVKFVEILSLILLQVVSPLNYAVLLTAASQWPLERHFPLMH